MRSRLTTISFFAAVPALALALGMSLAASRPAIGASPAGAPPGGGDAPGSAAFYQQRVKPIFEANCYRCHGGLNHRGGLVLDTQAGLAKGGHDGPVLVPGHPEQSLLVKLIRHEGPKDDPMPMPPKSKLSDAEIGTVEQWVRGGAAMAPDGAR